MATAPEAARRPDSPASLEGALAIQRRAYQAEPYPALAVRRDRLARLAALIRENGADIRAAISADFGLRAAEETQLLEEFTSLEGIAYARRRLARWMRRERRGVAWWSLPGRAWIMRQPLGVVGIIVPWNYPLYLASSPLTAALAAGNRALLKLSEHTPRYAGLFASLVERRFDAGEARVVTGDAEVARAFAALPFDHLLFTGSTRIGREVMRSAGASLTPVTLELGGKSPVIVARGFPVEEAARRIMYGKLLNAGQTCVAPDYALVPGEAVDRFVAACAAATRALYPTVAGNPQYTSIVDDRQFARLESLVDEARASGAGVHRLHDEPVDRSNRRMPPVAVTGAAPDLRLLQEEIFGPVLPVVAYGTLDEALAFVNERARPLALYYFGDTGDALDAVLERTVAGGVTVNNTGLHVIQESLPFGGVGASGTGQYHGKAGFDAFSKQKPVFVDRRLSASRLLMPPYGVRFRAILKLLSR